MIEWIPWIVAGMILYDLSIHLAYLFGKDEFLLDRNINWWPTFWTKKKGFNWRAYQRFWGTYWGIAFVLMVIYLIFR